MKDILFEDDFLVLRKCTVCNESVVIVKVPVRQLRCDEHRYIKFVCNRFVGIGKYELRKIEHESDKRFSLHVQKLV